MTEQTYKVVKQLGILVELVEKACEGCGFTGLAESDERIVIGLEHGFQEDQTRIGDGNALGRHEVRAALMAMKGHLPS
jgi:hypothetical protein